MATSKERAHAILSPSSAEKWITCPPSARFEEQIAEKPSEFAEEGDLAHDLARLYLLYQLDRIDAKEYDREIKRIAKSEHYDKAMLEYCTDYGDYILSLGGDILVEFEYTFTPERWGLPRNWGTSDATNRVDKTLYITDFKFGAGVKVYVKENKQAMCYAWGALNHFREQGVEIDKVVIGIYQPRIGSIPLDTWEITADELAEWAENELKESALLAISGLGHFKAGDHCRFCKARTSCAAFYKKFKDMRDARVITAKQRAEILEDGDAVVKFINAVRSQARDDILSGKRVRGFKLIRGRSNRAYKDEDLIIDALVGAGYTHDDIFEVSVKSLTALEKSLGKKKFNELVGDLITQIESGAQLANEDDPRPSYGASLRDAFDEQDEDDDLNSIL